MHVRYHQEILRFFPLLIIASCAHVSVASQELSLRSADGSQEAKFLLVDFDRHGVDLISEGGVELRDVNLAYFNESSQALLLEKGRALKPEMPREGANLQVDSSALNELFGIELFHNRSIWDEVPGLLAQRLTWPLEGESKFSSSYRVYFGQGREILGARCWTASILTEEGQVKRISLVFANRGDAFQAAGFGQDHFVGGMVSQEGIQKFHQQLESDKEIVKEKLTSLLGEAKKQRFGDGRARTKVLRWDWLDHAFLLVEHEEVMVQLLIVADDFADETGKVKRVPDQLVEDRIAQCVTRRENGDVILDQIPMVDQGPKGYCVPATMERVLRYMSVPADMYEIAVLAQSGFGGGTNMQSLLEGLHHDIRWGGRAVRESREKELNMKEIVEQIDQGIPLLWLLSSTPEYNQLSDQITKQRAEMRQDRWQDYVLQQQKQADKGIQLQRGAGNHHIVLIIGYNQETAEIATSDSWGAAYQERWVSLKEAKQVSQGAPFWIEP